MSLRIREEIQTVPWENRLNTDYSKKDRITVHAVAGLIMRDGKLLMAERPEGKPYSGYWEFPGGKIEDDEDVGTAIKRELHEELGIEVTNAEPWFEHLHAYPDKTVFLELWLIKEFSGEPQGLENQQLRWVGYEEILHLNLLEGNLAIVSQIKSLFS
jgi:8-oxo-dGTP diphosphatase